MGKQPKHAQARGKWRKPGRGRAALMLMAVLAACQAEPPPIADQSVLPCRTSWEDCPVATPHYPRWRVSHRHRIRTALRRHTPDETRRDVDAILEGMRRAHAAPRIAPSPANSTP